MMKDEDCFKFRALKMSLLVDSEAVAVRMIEGTLLAVSDLSSPRLFYKETYLPAAVNGRALLAAVDNMSLCYIVTIFGTDD